MIRAGVGQSQKQLTGQAVEEAACQAMARAGISRADLAPGEGGGRTGRAAARVARALVRR